MKLKTHAPACATAVALLALAGCNMFQSKEEQCLQSDRLSFKDPDSLAVVQNLGQRGQVASNGEEFFWLRYKAKNSYGAFLSRNMACEKREDEWVRDRSRETLAVLKATEDDLVASNAALKQCKTKACFDAILPGRAYLSPEEQAARRSDKAEEKAEARVFDSLENL